jgi:type IX secretion system PorP/SprF family membrane protein
MKKISISLYVLLVISGVIQAQSYHFSQFFSTPLLTNPAHTGLTNGPYRVASNLRSQGMIGGSPYFTGYVSGDVSPLRKYLPAGHKAGLGMYVMNDKSLAGAFQTNSVAISAAYNLALDKFGKNNLGLGLQGTYNQRRIDFGKLSFGNQWGPDGYDPSRPIGEIIPTSSEANKNYLDVNAGMLYNLLLEKKAFFAGVSVYNILRHNDNILPEEFKMPTRYMIQGGSKFPAGDEGNLYISLTHMRQAKAAETVLGAAYGLRLQKEGEEGEENELSFGMWYRHKDAIIPYVGYQLNGFRAGLSYDYTVSEVKTGAQVKNAYELTLSFSAIDKLNLKTTVPWF